MYVLVRRRNENQKKTFLGFSFVSDDGQAVGGLRRNYTPTQNKYDDFSSNSFRTLASEDFPTGYSKSACVSAYTQKTSNLRCCFLKQRLTNTPRRHRLADGQLS